MSTHNMVVHLSIEGRPACNNYTSYERKLSENLNDVNCGTCKRTEQYRTKKSGIKLKPNWRELAKQGISIVWEDNKVGQYKE